MALLKTKSYIKQCQTLTNKDKTLLKLQEKRLEKDILHPLLHTKRLKGFGSDRVYSFRVTRTYRGVFRIQGDDVVLFAIGHRKDIYDSL